MFKSIESIPVARRRVNVISNDPVIAAGSHGAAELLASQGRTSVAAGPLVNVVLAPFFIGAYILIRSGTIAAHESTAARVKRETHNTRSAASVAAR